MLIMELQEHLLGVMVLMHRVIQYALLNQELINQVQPLMLLQLLKME